MLEHYWQGLMKLQPIDATVFGDNSMNDQFVNNCTQAYRGEVHNFYQTYLDSLKYASTMNEVDALSFKILNFDAEMQVEKAEFESWKIPFTQMGDASNTLSGNIVLAMGQLGSGESSQPFKTVKDYDNWLMRVHAYTDWCDSGIYNFRQGMASNYVLPKTLVVKMIDLCNGLISEDESQSILYEPIKNMPNNFSAEDKTRITEAYKKSIKNELNVSRSKLADFLKNEYLPVASLTSGIGDLPRGVA